jgi:TetR/AcrR family transcriptional regulator, regulator of autoinduction and epiphytic fitness
VPTTSTHLDTATARGGRPSAVSRDPRARRSREAVLRAAVEELGAVGYGAFTVESVAARAGIAKSTFYRHWPDGLAVISDALETFHAQMRPLDRSGSYREQLVVMLEHVAQILADSPFAACIPALVDGAERDPAVARFHHTYSAGRRAELAAVVEAGIASGELPASADVTLVVLCLLGPLFYSRLMTNASFDGHDVRALVDAVLPPVTP